ncbi:MAG: NADH-quinone oxidoreductase subunit L [Candidatus Omnitrophica bacterium]|nr:NADH-quinone oxidoreductase subunit L [Candidatus Omnitrophota bacterium]
MEGLLNHCFWIPLFPLFAAALIAIFKNNRRKAASSLAILAIALSFIFSILLFLVYLRGHEEGHGTLRVLLHFPWFTSGGTPEVISFIVDPLTLMMLLVVTLVSLLVFIYSLGYMHEDPNSVRFFCFLSLFAASMLSLVISNHLLILFMCWELVGLCSYLLIGFWYEKPEAAEAAKKAFIVTRIGDIGFFIGLLLLYQKTGSLLLYGEGHPSLFSPEMLHLLKTHAVTVPFFGGILLTTLLGVLLFMGAMGKSAQFPLHVWLPDAMEGPTPVSALIHAATMVAAGVFLVARMFPLLDGTGAMTVISWTGGFTALFAATIAIAQFDIKRVLAYSTISQLGYMMMGLGLGGLVAGTFHLMTHAFFKALLFLGSGSVIHGCHGEQDMRKMGGLRKEMPVTFWTYLTGTLALAGIFPFSGFFSKDEILTEAFTKNRTLYGIGTLTAFLTAFYMFRQIFMVFLGKGRLHGHPHESPPTMLWPLRILAVLALVSGFVGTPFLFHNPFHHFIAADREGVAPSYLVMIVSTTVALSGILTAYLIYGRRAFIEDPLIPALKGFFRLLEKKYYMDELYQNTFVRAISSLASLFKTVDQVLIDGFLHLTGFASLTLSRFNQWIDNFFINGGFDKACAGIRGGGGKLGRLQTGRAQDYLLYASIGAMVSYLLFRLL